MAVDSNERPILNWWNFSLNLYETYVNSEQRRLSLPGGGGVVSPECSSLTLTADLAAALIVPSVVSADGHQGCWGPAAGC